MDEVWRVERNGGSDTRIQAAEAGLRGDRWTESHEIA